MLLLLLYSLRKRMRSHRLVGRFATLVQRPHAARRPRPRRNPVSRELPARKPEQQRRAGLHDPGGLERCDRPPHLPEDPSRPLRTSRIAARAPAGCRDRSAMRWERLSRPRRRWPARSPTSKPSRRERQPAPFRRLRASPVSAGELGRCAASRPAPHPRRSRRDALSRITWPPCGRWPSSPSTSGSSRSWHAFHLPLCFLLFAATIVHVIAAHLY